MVQFYFFYAALTAVYLATQRRAYIEASFIGASKTALGTRWHAEMWLTGKAPLGFLVSAAFALSFDTWQYKLIGFGLMGYTSMCWYWLWFDRYLNRERGLDVWYISEGKITALTDRTLRLIRDASNLSNRQAHLLVKVPLLALGVIGCVVLIILN